MAEISQQAVIDFLGSSAAHGGHAVQRIDTHAASVFLAGPRAVKIKRAVRFPFLDFSTLEKRRKACEAEIAINRAYAPGLYRAVVAITREPNGTLAIAGKGQPVEWAVEMKRFDESQTLDHLADDGEIDATLADALGRAVAGAHKLARGVTRAHFAETLADIIAQNETELAGEPDLIPLADLRTFAAATRETLERVTPLLQARERAGLVRRCHGDLHLGNIVLMAEKPVLFDAIEFDERIATSDVFYDLAFLLMDLVERGLQGRANIVLNRYLTETGRIHDYDALAALPLFMSVRAAIRAKVTAARRRQDQSGEGAHLVGKARAYIALAQKLLAKQEPALIAIGGLSGTGKSLLARNLAAGLQPPPGAVVLRSDVERKRLSGIGELESLPPTAYTADFTAKVYSVLADKARRAFKAGHSVIVDAVFAQPSERSEIARAADGGRFVGLFLTADLKTRMARVGGRTGDASDADANVVQMQEEFDLGRVNWSRVDAAGTAEETLIRAMAMLGLA